MYKPLQTHSNSKWMQAPRTNLEWTLNRFVETQGEVSEACLWLDPGRPAAATVALGSMPAEAPSGAFSFDSASPSPWAPLLTLAGAHHGLVQPLRWEDEPSGTLLLVGDSKLRKPDPIDLQALTAAAYTYLRSQRLAEELDRRRGDESFYSVGKLAYGIAPELDSMLREVLGHAQLAEGLRDPEQSQKALGTVLSAARRAKELTEPLTSFGRQAQGLHEPVAAASLVEQALVLIRNSMDQSKIKIVSQIPELPPVSGDRQQLLQVLVNLLFNAQQAIGSAGLISIQCRALDNAVEIAIEDSSDTSASSLNRDPRPHGFGLESSKLVVSQHGGSLEVAPGSTMGTRIALRLPTSEPDAVGSGETGPECILILERDTEQRQIIESVLRTMGHQELVSLHPTDGRESLAGRPLSLAILDALPEPGLPNMYTALRSRGTTLPIVFAVNRDHMGTANSLADPWSFLLNKPFRKRDLAALVARLLDLRAHSAA